MKTMIVYHDNCIDGITAATVTVKHLMEVKEQDRKDIEVYPMSYDDDIEKLHSELINLQIGKLYIVDFSFKLEELKTLCAFCKVRLLDHHASAFRNILGADYKVQPDSQEYLNLREGNLKIFLDNNECGASLCYKHLLSNNGYYESDNKLPNLIKFVKDHDLWRFELGYTKAIHKYLVQLPREIGVYLSLLVAFEDDDYLNKAFSEGDLLLTYIDKLEDELIEQGVTPITIDGVRGLCCNAPYVFASNIGHKLAVNSKSFGAVWTQKAGGIVIFSLRSNGDECDVSKLAEVMGGGGHKNASGFSFLSPEYDANKGITLWSTIEEKSNAS